ncbi:MAG: hypothetical protein ACREVV_07780, partial [Steroidobacteraceae bacterium]
MTLYTGGFSRFIASTTAPIATGWSESLPGGICTHWKTMPLHGAQNSGHYQEFHTLTIWRVLLCVER